MRTVQLGDMTIRVRDWPTPDTKKCTRIDDLRIGSARPDGCSVLEFVVVGGRWVVRNTYFGLLDRPGPDFPGELLGWFWLTEPQDLTWEHPTEETWTSGPWSITRTANTGYPFWYLLDGPESAETRLTHMSLSEAQREAASLNRDMLTRRDP
jgi:hypothetical protein